MITSWAYSPGLTDLGTISQHIDVLGCLLMQKLNISSWCPGSFPSQTCICMNTKSCILINNHGKSLFMVATHISNKCRLIGTTTKKDDKHSIDTFM